MNLFFEQLNEFTNTTFSSFEGEPFLTFLVLTMMAIFVIGAGFVIYSYNKK